MANKINEDEFKEGLEEYREEDGERAEDNIDEDNKLDNRLNEIIKKIYESGIIPEDQEASKFNRPVEGYYLKLWEDAMRIALEMAKAITYKHYMETHNDKGMLEAYTDKYKKNIEGGGTKDDIDQGTLDIEKFWYCVKTYNPKQGDFSHYYRSEYKYALKDVRRSGIITKKADNTVKITVDEGNNLVHCKKESFYWDEGWNKMEPVGKIYYISVLVYEDNNGNTVYYKDSENNIIYYRDEKVIFFKDENGIHSKGKNKTELNNIRPNKIKKADDKTTTIPIDAKKNIVYFEEKQFCWDESGKRIEPIGKVKEKMVFSYADEKDHLVYYEDYKKNKIFYRNENMVYFEDEKGIHYRNKKGEVFEPFGEVKKKRLNIKTENFGNIENLGNVENENILFEEVEKRKSKESKMESEKSETGSDKNDLFVEKMIGKMNRFKKDTNPDSEKYKRTILYHTEFMTCIYKTGSSCYKDLEDVGMNKNYLNFYMSENCKSANDIYDTKLKTLAEIINILKENEKEEDIEYFENNPNKFKNNDDNEISFDKEGFLPEYVKGFYMCLSGKALSEFCRQKTNNSNYKNYYLSLRDGIIRFL